MDELIPTVQFVITPKRALPYNWILKVGSGNASHMMDTWSVENKQTTANVTTVLADLPQDLTDQSFNLTISCAEFPVFKTQLNMWAPGPNNPRNSNVWDSEVTVDGNHTDMRKVQIEGAMLIDYIGFALDGCLTLSSNGLIVPQFGANCEQNLETVCEHQSCYTIEGNECVFPFKYKGVEYHNCTSEDVYQPWCATGQFSKICENTNFNLFSL